MKLAQVNELMERGMLISPDIFTEDINTDIIPTEHHEGPAVLNKTFYHLYHKKSSQELNWLEFERAIALKEKGRNSKTYETFLNLIHYEENPQTKKQLDTLLKDLKQETKKQALNITPTTLEITITTEPLITPPTAILTTTTTISPTNILPITNLQTAPIMITKTFKEDLKKRDATDFTQHFRNRYEKLKGFLSNRVELQEGLTSINKIKNKEEREEIAIIGIIFEKRFTKNEHLELTVEDITGTAKIIIMKNRRDIYERGKDLVVDQVIGIRGTKGDKNTIFANILLEPDVPKDHPLKKAPDEIYAAFISDIHVGSRKFLEQEFIGFIKWLNLEKGTPEELEKIKKIKYLFVVGDLVDGVGVYPGQETELNIPDIEKQYERAAELLNLIRKDITIIVCPGQHDAIRNSEPQPPMSKTYANKMHEISNLLLVGNPTYVNIAATPEFSGINVLMYHGASFHHFIDTVDSLRIGKARDNPRLLMKFLLQKRHLAPSHAATVYVPSITEDPMIIDPLPDIFCCGDMHRSDISSYNNITTINGSCWQAKTTFQEKTGNNPDFCRVPLVNLKTRDIEMLKFHPDDH
ncbi:MAG: metallophosphoesterase [Nanoarchaeota archaeon]|nr:metallophosphoesterase [Nanoarchaeota archaeon]